MIDGNLLLSVVPQTLDERGESAKAEHHIVPPEQFFAEIAGQVENVAPLASGATTATITTKVNELIAGLKEAGFMARDWIITNTLTKITSSDTTLTIPNGQDYTATLTAESGYTLPETITVKVEGVELESGYTYTQGTGVVTISAVSGDVEIIAVAEEATV